MAWSRSQTPVGPILTTTPDLKCISERSLARLQLRAASMRTEIGRAKGTSAVEFYPTLQAASSTGAELRIKIRFIFVLV